MNILKPTNWKKQQDSQNKALRWVNGDVPPYATTVQALHTKYNLEPLNIRNHRLAYSRWEKIRTEFPIETNKYEVATFNRTHAWWPLAYMSAEATEPRPIYGNIRARNDQSGLNHWIMQKTKKRKSRTTNNASGIPPRIPFRPTTLTFANHYEELTSSSYTRWKEKGKSGRRTTLYT